MSFATRSKLGLYGIQGPLDAGAMSGGADVTIQKLRCVKTK
jgi:hypothetical protein